MNRLLILLPLFTALGLAQDSGLYINRVKLFPRSDANNHYTYLTMDSYKTLQKDQYSNDDHDALGSFYEDDLSAQSTTCQTTECPKLVKIFSYMIMAGSAINTTRVGDASLAQQTGVEGLPLGYLAPYPGYCSSTDQLPIVEMYSMAQKDKKYVYWSPLDKTQYSKPNLAATTYEKFQIYTQPKLVGYALENVPTRLVLENAAPDFMKPTGKANFTHYPYEAFEIVRYTTPENKELSVASPPMIALANDKGLNFVAGTGIFLFGKPPAAAMQSLTKTCGEVVKLWNYCTSKTSFAQCRIGTYSSTSTAMKPLVLVASAGEALKVDNAKSQQCGGIEGLGKLREFVKADLYRYAVTESQVATLIGDGYTQTASELGFVPKDSNGFFLLSVPMVGL